MKHLFFCFFAVTSLFIIGCSDDPCKDVNCGNGTCDSDMGTCICDTGYEGDNCDIEQRTKFIGTWNSSDFTCDGDPPEDVTLIITAGEGVSEVIVADPDQPSVLITSSISGNSVTVVPQIITVDQGIEVNLSGTGNVIDGVLSLNIVQEVIGSGTFTCTGTFTK